MKSLLSAASLLALSTMPAWAEPVKIGVITTLSGPSGYIGEQVRDAMHLAIEQSGGKLGGVDVELVVEDDALNPGNGRQIADKFVNDEEIKVLTGIIFSNVAGAVVPDVVDSGAFYISSNAAPSSLAGEGCHENYFVASWQNDSLHEATGMAAKSLGYGKAVALAPNYQAGKDAIAGFSREFGGEVEAIYTQLDQTDFASEMARIRAAAPEVVFQFHPGGTGISFLKQYAQSGLLAQVPLVVSEPSVDGVILQAVGDAAVGVKATTHWEADFENEASKTFVAGWRAKYPDRPITYYAQEAYDTALLIGSALAKATPEDQEAFRTALRAADFASTRGDFSFGPNQHPVQSWHLIDIVKEEATGRIHAKTAALLRENVGDVYAQHCKM